MPAQGCPLVLPHLKFGSLRFWGEWFGGRAFENAHKIIDCDARDVVLHMRFNEGESLYVWSPQQVELNRQMFKFKMRLAFALNGSTTDVPRRTKIGTSWIRAEDVWYCTYGGAPNPIVRRLRPMVMANPPTRSTKLTSRSKMAASQRSGVFNTSG